MRRAQAHWQLWEEIGAKYGTVKNLEPSTSDYYRESASYFLRKIYSIALAFF